MQTDALVWIEAEVEQQVENLRTVMRDGDPQQSARAVVLVGQVAFRVTRAEPVLVSERRRCRRRHRSAPAEEECRDSFESLRVRSIPPVRREV